MQQILILIFLYFTISCNAQTHLITLGKGEDCNGFNICSLFRISKNYNPSNSETPLLISITKDNKLQFSFPKSKMKETIFLKYFATGFFILDGEYKLPEDICQQFKISSIKTGKYKVIATADSYEVIF